MTNRVYKVGGLFSGVGGIELGFSIENKFSIAWGTDIDRHASETYRANFKHKFIETDINHLKGSDLSEVDVLVGGFPCQAFSVAGYRKGFEDDRGNIFFQIIRIIKELPRKPRVLLLENVKNLATHDKNRTLTIIRDQLETLGYAVFNSILNTSEYTNIPHNRERTFILCFLADKYHPPETNPFKYLNHHKNQTTLNSINDFLEDNPVEEKYYYREDKYNYSQLAEVINNSGTVYQWRRTYVRENKSGVCPTLTANMGTGGHNVPLILDNSGIRKLTPRECFNLQGFPRDFKFPDKVPNTQLYKQAGNSVTVTLVRQLALLIYSYINSEQESP